MANICNTTYRFNGTKEMINKFWNKLTEINVDNQSVSLLEVAEHFGIDTKNIYVRGNIYSAIKSLDNDDENVITIYTETAWTACNMLFYKIMKQYDNEISMSYREIECGCNIFNVHDEDGFFCEECCVNAQGEQFGEDMCDELFDTTQSAIEFWCEQMNYVWDKEKVSKQDMLNIINNFVYEYDDTYFYINEFNFI